LGSTAGNSIGDDGSKALAEALKSNKSLNHLNLGGKLFIFLPVKPEYFDCSSTSCCCFFFKIIDRGNMFPFVFCFVGLCFFFLTFWVQLQVITLVVMVPLRLLKH